MPLTVSFSLGRPPEVATVPMAVGDPSPAWPLATTRRVITGDFGARRSSKRGGVLVPRVHVAEDLPAPRGSIVHATEAGRVVDAIDDFYKGSGYVLIQGDSGLVYVLGETEPGSMMVSKGDRVAKAQPVARVGRHHQLHFETYAAGTRRSHQWWEGDPPPPALRNPTAYLEAAARTVGPYDVPSLPPPSRPKIPAPAIDPEPVMPVHPQQHAPRAGGGAGWLLLAVLVMGVARG